MNIMEASKKDGESENLWNKLLGETRKMEDKDSHVIVLGNYDSAKKSLVAATERLMGERVVIESRNESSVIFSMKDKKNSGSFDYSYVSIRNPADESIELAKVNFWILNEKVSDAVLKQLLTQRRLKRLVVMIVLDFEKLGTLPDDLPKWFTYINQKILPYFKDFDLKEMDNLKARVADLVVNYIEPVRTDEGKIINKKTDLNPEAADKLFLPDGVLTANYGFPILLCMNKSDHILELRNERHPDEILETVEYTLRKNAYPYGASVLYTSPKQGTNIGVLGDYLKFLFFQMPFPHPYSPSKDSLFIPIGFDNAEIVATAYSGPSQKLYSEVIPKKEEQKGQTDIDFRVKSNQKFLEELKAMQPHSLNVSQSTRQSSTINAPGVAQQQPPPADNQGARQRFSREHRDRILNVLNRNNAGNQGGQPQGGGVPPGEPRMAAPEP